MRFKFLIPTFLFLLALTMSAIGLESMTLILNMENQEVLPRNFRTASDPVNLEGSVWKPSLEGLNVLRMSGSAQFSEKSVQAILTRLQQPRRFIIVDLRQESHGFVNGIAISWFTEKDWGNKGKSLEEVELTEKNLLADLLKQKSIVLHTITEKTPQGNIESETSYPVIVKNVATEAKVAEYAEVGYFRIAVTDHMGPSEDDVERFLLFLKGLPKDGWLHFHCAAGEGRTTTFMAMYDMYHNAKKVSFDDIIDRQWLLGGSRLSQLPASTRWKYPCALERYQFLKRFYDFCRQDPQQSWKDFLKTKERVN